MLAIPARPFLTLLGGGALVCLEAFPLWAEPITAKFTPVLIGDLAPSNALSWSAMPLDLAEDADTLSALIIAPEPIVGAWEIALEPGPYVVSGYSDTAIFEAEITLTSAGDAAFTIPEVKPDANLAFQCEGDAPCHWRDAITGLEIALPPGWAVEQPYMNAPQDRARLALLTAVFFEQSDDEGAAVWFLNPEDWLESESGPCREVALGKLCTFELSQKAEGAFATLAAQMKLSAAPAAAPN